MSFKKLVSNEIKTPNDQKDTSNAKIGPSNQKINTKNNSNK